MQKLLLIANPAAGRGRAGAHVEKLKDLFERAGESFELHLTREAGDARETARREARRYEIVAAFGGDGTHGEVAGGLAEARLAAPPRDDGPFAALGLLPGGTGNDLCLATGVPKSLREAVALLLRDRRRDLDIGRIRWKIEGEAKPRERLFANNVGLGFEGQVGYRAESIRAPLRGVALYVVALLRELGDLVNPHLRITLGSGEAIAGPMLLLSVGNGPSSGGGFLLNPRADAFDGLLDIAAASARGRMQVLRLIPKAMRGDEAGIPEVQRRRDTRLTVETDTPFHGHVDGELVGERIVRVEIELLPGLLPLIC